MPERAQGRRSPSLPRPGIRLLDRSPSFGSTRAPTDRGALPGGRSSLAAVGLRQLYGAVVRYVRGAMKRAAWAEAANPVADPRLPGRRLDQP